MSNFMLEVTKFWTKEKYDWLSLFEDESSWDDELKRYLASFFNKRFGSDKSPEAVYRHFRKVHPKSSVISSISRNTRLGMCKRGRIRSNGVSSLKLNGL